MVLTWSYAKIWQIFGKMGFDDNSRYEGKVRIAAYLLVCERLET